MTKVELLDELDKLIEEIPPSRIAGEGLEMDCKQWANQRLGPLLQDLLLHHSRIDPGAWGAIHQSMTESIGRKEVLHPQELLDDAKRTYLRLLKELVSRMS
ncbi:MAG: hypothetical protein OXB94_07920 [Nitrospira sp.]|nr:hypothetical protein [Nitrospira sp.]